MNQTGLLLLARHVLDLALVFALLGVGAAVGLTVVRRVGASTLRGVEPLILAIPVGLGIVATGTLLLGMAGVLRPIAILSWIVVLTIVARHELRRLPARCREIVAALVPDPEERWQRWVALGVTAVVAAFVVMLTLAPPTDWDALMYHLEVPRQFLETGRIMLPPDNLHAAFAGLAHLLYVPLLAAGSASGPGLLSAAFALLLALAVYGVGSRALGRTTASVAVTLLWGTTTLVLVAITPRVDVTLTYYLFVAHAALLVVRDDGDRGALWLAAVLLGFGVGLKYQAAAYALALVPLAVWASSGPGWGARVRDLALLSGVAAAVALPWFIKNWMLLDAPTYPLFADARLEPWLAALYGSPVPPDTMARTAFEPLRALRVPFNVVDAFIAPHRLTVEGEGVFYRLNPLLVLVPLSLGVARRRAVLALLVPALLYLVVVIMASPETNLRYLLPAIPALTLASAAVLVEGGRRVVADRVLRALVLSVALAGGLYWTMQVVYRWTRYSEAAPHLVGARSGWSFLKTYVDPTTRLAAPTMERVNQLLGADDQVLMLFEARGFHYTVPVLQDNRLTNWLLVSGTDAPDRCLESTGITHVLLSGAALRYYVARGLDPSQLGWGSFPRFAERCLAPVFEHQGYALYRVRSLRESGT